MHASQNPYDDSDFFEGYGKLPRSIHGLDGAPEWPTLRAMLPPLAGAHVADLGCGYGWFCRWAVAQGAATIVGHDLSVKMLERASADTSRDLPIVYQNSDLEQLELPIDTFDVVYSSLAFHYIVDIGRLVRSIHGSLKLGGSFVFSVEHPIRTAPHDPGFTTDASGQDRWPIDHYLVEGPRSTDWIAPGVIKHHRTISTYLTAMLESGFTIRTIDEWCPSPGQLAQNPEWSNELHRPSFLLVGATR